MSSEWTMYFDVITHLLQGASRQYGVANESYTEYVIERLDLCISTCTTLKEQLTLSSASEVNDDQEGDLVVVCKAELEELVDSLMQVQIQWKHYQEVLEAGISEEFSFRVDTGGAGAGHGRGRPRFNVSREQLEYLSSLGFSWSEIASILGVSRMTVYRYVWY